MYHTGQRDQTTTEPKRFAFRSALMDGRATVQRHTGPSTERFLIEAQATARCRHDNIVVIHEVDAIHGYPYMVLEYLEGRTLREWLAQRERLAGSEPAVEAESSSGLVSPSLAVELMLPVVRALACA